MLWRGLAIDKVSFGPDHPTVATRLNNLALILQDTNRIDEAEPLMRRALAIDQAAFGPDHANVARDLNNLGIMLLTTNRLAEAESSVRRALIIDEANLGPDHPKVATKLNSLANLLQATNRVADAEPLMRRVVVILRLFGERTGHEHPHMQAAIVNYYHLLAAMKLPEDEIAARLQQVLSPEP
jgi:tetratricopeptide (TPR) repeat protein